MYVFRRSLAHANWAPHAWRPAPNWPSPRSRLPASRRCTPRPTTISRRKYALSRPPRAADGADGRRRPLGDCHERSLARGGSGNRDARRTGGRADRHPRSGAPRQPGPGPLPGRGRAPRRSHRVVGRRRRQHLGSPRRARALGVGLLSGGYGRAELESAGAYRVYEDPADLLLFLDEVGVRSAV